jgi:hypothetical protein
VQRKHHRCKRDKNNSFQDDPLPAPYDAAVVLER